MVCVLASFFLVAFSVVSVVSVLKGTSVCRGSSGFEEYAGLSLSIETWYSLPFFSMTKDLSERDNTGYGPS